MGFNEIQDRLEDISAQERALREERKSLEHELAALKKDRKFTGPVYDGDGNIVSANIEGVTATADVIGNSIDNE